MQAHLPLNRLDVPDLPLTTLTKMRVVGDDAVQPHQIAKTVQMNYYWYAGLDADDGKTLHPLATDCIAPDGGGGSVGDRP